MFGSKKKKSPKAKAGAADTLICRATKIIGDLQFSGVLYVDGHVKGNINAEEMENSLLTIGQNGCVEGEINVPHIIVLGRVSGDVHAFEHIELMSDAHIEGNVYYKLIEMAMGAEVNGKLVHKEDKTRLLAHHKDDHHAEDSASQADNGKVATIDGKDKKASAHL